MQHRAVSRLAAWRCAARREDLDLVTLRDERQNHVAHVGAEPAAAGSIGGVFGGQEGDAYRNDAADQRSARTPASRLPRPGERRAALQNVVEELGEAARERVPAALLG